MATVLDLCQGFTIGMHGGGELFGFQKNNSADALERWLSKGICFFEFDVSETSDKQFVAFAHRLNESYLSQVELSPTLYGCSKDWFLSSKLYPFSSKGLSTLCVDNLLKLLESNPSIIIMFDLFAATKDEVQRFAAYLRDNNKENILSRVLVEVYDLDVARVLLDQTPNINIIYGVQPDSLIWLDNSARVNRCFNREFIAELKLFNIRFISFQWSYRKLYSKGIRELADCGFCVLSHKDSDLKAYKCHQEGVSILLIDFYYGDNKFLFTRINRYFEKCKAKLRLNINKIKRTGLQGTIKKVAERLK